MECRLQHLKPYIHILLNKFEHASFSFVGRQENTMTDKLAKEASARSFGRSSTVVSIQTVDQSDHVSFGWNVCPTI